MKNLLLLSLFALLIAACKDKEELPPQTYPDYGNLKAGNYWIYQHFVLESDGTILPSPELDSVYVEKDTLIAGKRYAKLMDVNEASEYQASFLRDSLHYRVTSDGVKTFSSENFTSVLHQGCDVFGGDTLFCIQVTMADDGLSAQTPAGPFVTKSVQTAYYMNFPPELAGTTVPLFRRYAENVGLVYETRYFFISDPSRRQFGRYLVRWGPR